MVVQTQGKSEVLSADAYVVALGSYSPLLLKPLGIRLPVYPAKGYSATLTLAEGSVAPTVSVTDDECKLVFPALATVSGLPVPQSSTAITSISIPFVVRP